MYRKIIITDNPINPHGQEPDTFYTTIPHFVDIRSFISTNGYLTSYRLKNILESAKIAVPGFSKKMPIIYIDGLRYHFENCPAFWSSTEKSAHPISSRNYVDNITANSLLWFLSSIIGIEAANKFFDAYLPEIWSVSTNLLNCSQVIPSDLDSESTLEEHIISLNTHTGKLTVCNNYKGLNFISSSKRCTLCNQPKNQAGCCCKDIVVKEYLTLSLQSLEYFFKLDKIIFTEVSPEFLNHIIGLSHSPIMENIAFLPTISPAIILINNPTSKEIFSPTPASIELQKSLKNFYFIGSPISEDGKIIMHRRSDIKLCAIDVHQGFLAKKPQIILIKNNQETIISFQEFSSYSNTGYKMNDIINNLKFIAGSTALDEAFIYGYEDFIWNVALVLLRQPISEENRLITKSNHTIIFNLDARQIKLVNKYRYNEMIIQEQLSLFSRYNVKKDSFIVDFIAFADYTRKFFNLISAQNSDNDLSAPSEYRISKITLTNNLKLRRKQSISPTATFIKQLSDFFYISKQITIDGKITPVYDHGAAAEENKNPIYLANKAIGSFPIIKPTIEIYEVQAGTNILLRQKTYEEYSAFESFQPGKKTNSLYNDSSSTTTFTNEPITNPKNLAYALNYYFGEVITIAFLSAYTQTIWSPTELLLTYKSKTKNLSDIRCSKLDKVAKNEHVIRYYQDKLNKTTKLEIYNRYKGIKFLTPNLTIPLPDCEEVIIEELLYLDTAKEVFIVDTINLCCVPTSLWTHLNIFFPVAGENSLIQTPIANEINTILITNNLQENTIAQQTLNGPEANKIFYKYLECFFQQNSPISFSGGIISTAPNPTYSDEKFLDQKRLQVYDGLFAMHPSIRTKHAENVTSTQSFAQLNESTIPENFMNSSKSPGALIGDKLSGEAAIQATHDALILAVGEQNLINQFLLAYNINIWNPTLVLLSNPDQKITALRHSEQINQLDKHEIFFDLVNNSIHIYNCYVGIKIESAEQHCAICGNQDPNTAHDCTKTLKIEEHLEYDRQQKIFIIKTVRFTAFNQQFLRHIMEW